MKNLAWKAEKMRKSRASIDSVKSVSAPVVDPAAAPAAAAAVEGGEAAANPASDPPPEATPAPDG